MNARTVTVDLMLYGFPELGLPGGSRQVSTLEMPLEHLTGRGICRALLERFGSPMENCLSRAKDDAIPLNNVHVFVNDTKASDFDERLDDRVNAENRIGVLLILVKAIAGG